MKEYLKSFYKSVKCHKVKLPFIIKCISFFRKINDFVTTSYYLYLKFIFKENLLQQLISTEHHICVQRNSDCHQLIVTFLIWFFSYQFKYFQIIPRNQSQNLSPNGVKRNKWVILQNQLHYDWMQGNQMMQCAVRRSNYMLMLYYVLLHWVMENNCLNILIELYEHICVLKIMSIIYI